MQETLLRPTIAPLLREDNSIDIVRYYLSFAVLFAHFSELTESAFFFPTSSYTAVGGFFMLSGFLVFYSYLRTPTLFDYFKRRACRILPPYFAVVLFCALGGVFLSNLSPTEYFTSSTFFRYVAANLSFANLIQPTLPGVFADNPYPFVNGSLWTMKVEVLLYLSVPVVAWVLTKGKKSGMLILIYVISCLYKMWMDRLYEQTGDEIYAIMQRQVVGQLLYFYAGAALLLYFDTFQRYFQWIFPAGILLCFSAEFVPFLEYVQPLGLAVVIIGFSYNCRWFSWLRKYDNVSYAVYLFHYPIIQMVVHFELHQVSVALALFVVVVLTLVFAILSWHCIEKPIMERFRR